MCRFFVVILILGAFSASVWSQGVELRTYAGVTYYQGDLSPSPSNYSLSPGNPAYGASVMYAPLDYFRVGFRYMSGELSGNDEQADHPWRRNRNLSFYSDVSEFGIITEFSLNYFFKKMNQFGIDLYATFGINVFSFKPKTSFQGLEVELQPLSLEGQGIPGFPNQKVYALTQVNLPFGLGWSFQLSPNFTFGMEISPRITFTDYLDDVSSIYIDFDTLLANRGELAAALGNRTGEFLNTPPVKLDSGTLRGDPNDNDWYLFTGVYLSYRIPFRKPAPPEE